MIIRKIKQLEQLAIFTRIRYRLLWHIVGGIVVVVLLLGYFFNGYLHQLTHHGESITVPDLRGMSEQEAITFLSERLLNYKVAADSDFSIKVPPLTVLNQYPLPEALVKERRSIILTLNTLHPPTVKMPLLIDGSLKSAQLRLLSLQLRLGEVSFVPDLALNAVLRQLHKGNPIAAGTPIEQGATIDLIVGDGLGIQNFAVPSLIGLSEEEAVMVIIGSGLRIGKRHVGEAPDSLGVDATRVPKGLVFGQWPSPTQEVAVGDTVQIWMLQDE